MIGMIALAGIVIRNAIILIDFIRTRRAQDMELREAILQSGGQRLRPIVLTAFTTMLGAWPITLDPIHARHRAGDVLRSVPAEEPVRRTTR